MQPSAFLTSSQSRKGFVLFLCLHDLEVRWANLSSQAYGGMPYVPLGCKGNPNGASEMVKGAKWPPLVQL